MALITFYCIHSTFQSSLKDEKLSEIIEEGSGKASSKTFSLPQVGGHKPEEDATKEKSGAELIKLGARIEGTIATVKISSTDEEYIMRWSRRYLAIDVDLLLGYNFPESVHRELIPILKEKGYQVELEQYVSTGETLLIARSPKFKPCDLPSSCNGVRRESYEGNLGSIDEYVFISRPSTRMETAFEFCLKLLLKYEKNSGGIRQRLPLPV